MNNQRMRIHEKQRLFEAKKPFPIELIKNLDEWYKIELTYTSNAIEGNTLSRAETALIVEKGITVEGKSITEHLEAVNHANAWDFIKTITKSISERTILGIHAIILHGIDPTNAGRYRSVPVRIAGSTVVLPNPLKVPNLMTEFITWLNNSKEDQVDVALLAHFKLVSIHPFSDGNGRTARLLMNLLLMQRGFPPAVIRKEERKRYIDAIEHGQLTGNTTEYMNLLYESIERSQDAYLQALSPNQKRKLLKIGELAQKTGETIVTIRYWTKEGLLKPTSFTKGGYHLFDESAADQVIHIRVLQREKRMTIKELKKANLDRS